jgi:hypothetical protein
MAWKERVSTYLLRRLARSQGFMDPMLLFARLQRFSRPSEVWVPTELLRLGFVLQARGTINSQAIQNNLDWVWPYWIRRQFDPKDTAFIPRAFSISNINLTHRNWTALGIPDFPEYPLIDPRGLVTPFWDGWSIDGWIMSKDHPALFPSTVDRVIQKLDNVSNLKVTTESEYERMTLKSESWVEMTAGIPVCNIQFTATVPFHSSLAICVRPYNPEGVSFINEAVLLADGEGWKINSQKDIHLQEAPQRYVFSNYHSGDISGEIALGQATDPRIKKISCPVGMVSVAAVYELEPRQSRRITIRIPLAQSEGPITSGWEEHLEGHCDLKIPDPLYQFLYETALRTLILHSPGDVFPGPFTYKRFWFRDSAFILNAMMCAGLLKNIEKILDRFPARQTSAGYFMSQDGEWDSNGQAIWIMQRFAMITNTPMKSPWLKSVIKGAKWIQKKRLSSKEQTPHKGLLPTGFSAEHLGPNDYYYWDDFWSVAGLMSASGALLEHDAVLSEAFKLEAVHLSACIDESLKSVQDRLHTLAVPASPYRRMDGGAIGSLMASYPLQLWPPNDERMKATVDYLLKKCFLEGAFYHEISHSGINVYLSLQVAQVLLRSGDSGFHSIIKTVAKLATSTGQWPEAIHPQTKGGCMGDGQHVWAAAEWVLMMRNIFILEEEKTKTIILCAGIQPEWLDSNETMFFGKTPTIFGTIAVTITPGTNIRVSWKANWHGDPPCVEVHLPGYPRVIAQAHEQFVEIKKGGV